MFWLRNKKIKFSLHTLNESPDPRIPHGKVTKSQLDITNKREEVSPLMEGNCTLNPEEWNNKSI